MTRKSREDLAIGCATDVAGDDWLVRERRPTDHGFDLLFGWPVDASTGGVRAILTPEVARYLRAARRGEADLPLSDTALKRLRKIAGASLDAWWRDREQDLRTLTLRRFAERHGCTEAAASLRRTALRRADEEGATTGANAV